MTVPGPQVFISYHRADLAVAEQVRSALRAHQVRTWMDHYDIPAGSYWPDEIDQGLNASDLIVGLLSPDSVASRNVKNEWDWAIQNDKALVLLMTRPCVIPHRYIAINYIDATEAHLPAALETLTQLPELQPRVPDFPIPRTRYARSGDLNIAYQQFGEGPIDLVMIPGYISHVEHFWKLPAVATWFRRMATLSRMVIFDKRGTGMSDRPGRISTLEERMDDIRAVMDACQLERAVMFGVSEGVPLGILFAATYPQRTQALILYGGSATYVQQPDYPWAKPLAQRQQEIEDDTKTLYETWGTAHYAHEGIRRWGAPSQQNDEALVTWFAEMMRLGASPGAAIALNRMNLEVDVRHVLPTIRVPTLVLHRIGDHDANIDEGRYLAAHIPGAVLEELPGEDHFPFVGDQDAIFAAIERFLARVTSAVPAPETRETVLATIVHLESDDLDAKTVVDVARQDLERYRGRLVATGGSGISAVFDGPARAVRYANAVSEEARERGGTIRGGIQTGELALGERQASGLPVAVAQQLATLAQPDQLLATSTVRDLVAGSGIQFHEVPQEHVAQVDHVSQILAVDRDSLV